MRDADDDYGFDEDDGEISPPTMRGSANLDPQDYARGPSGRGSSLLDDEIQEDTPSTPGRNPGAATAPDVGGTNDWSIIDAEDGPGMEATTYGAHPWGPGGATGYRPTSMQRTDMALRDTLLRDAHLGDADLSRKPKPMERDDMHNEPEVLETNDNVEIMPPKWHGNRNERPSNEGIPRDTIYDRDSYEYSDSSGDTIGSGIFDMEEGVTWRPRDGQFAHQFALPAYIGDEDEMGIQQSEMFDTTANEWRVVQPSASGVPLSRTVDKYRSGYSPFVKRTAAMPEMRPEVTGPRSHIEAFGRKAANLIVAEAKAQPVAKRAQFVANAIESLGAGTAARTSATAKKLVEMGNNPQTALEDSIAHAVMHATVRDLQSAKRARGKFTNLDRLAARVQKTKPQMQAAAVKHLAPLAKNTSALKSDLGSLFSSPAALGMGQVAEGSTPAVITPTLFTPRNLVIGAVVSIGGYYAWQNRKKIMRNARKLARKAGLR